MLRAELPLIRLFFSLFKSIRFVLSITNGSASVKDLMQAASAEGFFYLEGIKRKKIIFARLLRKLHCADLVLNSSLSAQFSQRGKRTAAVMQKNCTSSARNYTMKIWPNGQRGSNNLRNRTSREERGHQKIFFNQREKTNERNKFLGQDQKSVQAGLRD